VVRDPHLDPGFQAMKARAGKAAGGAKAHVPAKAGAAAAQGAAAGPANEVASQAGAAQLDEMGEQQPGVFDKAAFVAAVKAAVDKAAPKDLEEADEFKKSGKAGKVKDEVAGIVKGGKQESEKNIKGATEAAPDDSKAQPKPVTPLAPEQPGAPPAPLGGAAAMPPPVPATATDLSAGPAALDSQMAEGKVTDEQLAKSGEPDFQGALKARDDAKEHAVAAPPVVRAQEKEILDKSKGEAEGVAGAQAAGMHGAKVQALAKAMGAQTQAKGADEVARAKVAADMQAIYKRTKDEVTAILTGLDAKVDTAFTKGEKAARDQFESYVAAEMDAYKEERYSGIGGGALWLSDKLFSVPDEVNRFYEKGRAGYLVAMDKVVDNVAGIVGTELGLARKKIADGRAEVAKFVKGLSPELQKVGKEAEEKLDGEFSQLASEVDAKQSELVDSLAQKYVAGRDAVDSRIEAMKEANKGFVDKARDAIVGVIKTILQLKDMLLGVLAKAGDVIETIISDPIGFMGKLADGVMSGLKKFVGNIGTHLQNALMDWLFGALGAAGITMPKTLDFAGILDLVMQVLGLTYNAIRARVVNIVGAPIVEKMEQTVEVFKILATEGVAGIWKWIQEKLSSLEDMVLGQIKTFVIEKVVKAGIVWIISMLNPAAAFIKACKAIYDFVMFIVERGSQIMEFVNSILDSIGAIAKGAIGIVADKIEGSLAKALPLAISMLASLLGLGGISEKIKSIIQVVKGPIDKAVDWLITGAVKGFKKLFGPAIAWAKGKYQKGKAFVKEKYEQGKAYVKGKVQGIKDKLTGKKPEADVQAEDPAAVKAAALDEVSKRGSGGAFSSVESFQSMIKDVGKQFKPKGLKSLTATVQDEASMDIAVTAVASPGDQRTIKWRDAFAGPGSKKLQEAFKSQGWDSFAALSLNKEAIGELSASGDTHAEVGLLNSSWPKALDKARKNAAKGETSEIVVVINRTPCPNCTARLVGKINEAKQDETIASNTKFILAPTGVYEPRKLLTPEQIAKAQEEYEKEAERLGAPVYKIVQKSGYLTAKDDQDKSVTTNKNLEDLVGAGWDLRALIAKDRQTVSGAVLGEFAHTLAQKLGK
jgi:hypothetical protein